MISNCGHDENGEYKFGQAGDQTGTEWEIKPWYNRPWDCVLRHPNREVGNMVAELGRAAAKNDLVGYDQENRYSYWEHLAASNYDPAQITIACEADCSSGVAANVKAAGYRLGIQPLKNVSIYASTSNLKEILTDAGFACLTESKYLTGDSYLLPGDILLKINSHTATNLDVGANADGGSFEPKVEAEIQLYTPNNTNAQRWWVYQNSDGTVSLKNAACGLFLDVMNALTSSGTKVRVYEGNGTIGQKWKIEEASGSYNPAAVRPLMIIPAVNTSLRLDCKDGGTADGTQIQTYNSNTSTAQQWQVLDRGDGTWIIINVGSSKALDVVAGGM